MTAAEMRGRAWNLQKRVFWGRYITPDGYWSGQFGIMGCRSVSYTHLFREILGDSNVLEHHSNMDDFTAEGLEETEELKAMHLAAENWDKPVIVTTNVQFFESLYGSRSSRCRKLHNIANSVIIFDEAQMLPTDYLKPCTAMIEELIANYRVSAVLCTCLLYTSRCV